MQFDEEFCTFEAEFANLGPRKVVQFGFALIEKESRVSDPQIECNPSILLKGKQVLKHISIIEQCFKTSSFVLTLASI